MIGRFTHAPNRGDLAKSRLGSGSARFSSLTTGDEPGAGRARPGERRTRTRVKRANVRGGNRVRCPQNEARSRQIQTKARSRPIPADGASIAAALGGLTAPFITKVIGELSKKWGYSYNSTKISIKLLKSRDFDDNFGERCRQN